MTLEDKKALWLGIRANLQQKYDGLKAEMQQLQNSANEETRSTAGDKYETGRAMAQLEVEKLGAQLDNVSQQLQILNKINIERAHDKVQSGSLVTTDRCIFFLSVSAGQIHVNGQAILCISPSSPIGSKLIGLSANNAFSFNNTQYKVHSVL